MRDILPALVARHIRIVPMVTVGTPKHICLRVELYGCSYDDGPIAYSIPQGDKRGYDVQFFDETFDGLDINGTLTGTDGVADSHADRHCSASSRRSRSVNRWCDRARRLPGHRQRPGHRCSGLRLGRLEKEIIEHSSALSFSHATKSYPTSSAHIESIHARHTSIPFDHRDQLRQPYGTNARRRTGGSDGRAREIHQRFVSGRSRHDCDMPRDRSYVSSTK